MTVKGVFIKMIKYDKLNEILKERSIKWIDIRYELGFSSKTVAKINKNEIVSLEVIDKLCDYLDVQPGEILEFIRDSKQVNSRDIMQEFQDFLGNPDISPVEKLRKSLEFGKKYGDSKGKDYLKNKK